MANVSSVTDLDLPDDGRALAVCDWDADGKDDIVLSSRTSPRLRLLRNNVNSRSGFLRIKLVGTDCNRDAIGARLTLVVGKQAERTLIRSLRAGEGFLSQSSKWIQFGLGDDVSIDRLEINWPGGDKQLVRGLQPNRRYTIAQGHDAIESSAATTSSKLNDLPKRPSKPSDSSESSARIVLTGPLVLPELRYLNHVQEESALIRESGRFTLITLWASWCAPCIRELEELNRHVENLRANNVHVLALNVDRLEQTEKASNLNVPPDQVAEFSGLEKGFATETLISVLDVAQRALLDRQRPLTLPTSFLLDERQRLLIIYRGVVDPTNLIEDVGAIRRDPNGMVRMAIPFPGRWHNQIVGPDPLQVAMRMIEMGDSLGASRYLHGMQQLPGEEVSNTKNVVATKLFLARLLAERNERAEAIATFEQVLQLDGTQLSALLGISHALIKSGREDEAIRFLKQALELDPQNSKAMAYFATARLQQGNGKAAARWYRQALKIRPNWLEVTNNLAWLLATDRDPEVRNGQESVQLAQKLCEATNYQIPGMLDTLAAAYANAGQFSHAVKTIDHAVKIAKSKGQGELLEKLLMRRRLYISDQPFRVGEG